VSTSPTPTPTPTQPDAGWRQKHLLDVDALSLDEIQLVMRTTDAMKEVLSRPIAKVPALRGTNVTILFYEASTRTRVSFEVAAKNLSADVVNIAASTSSVTKGESLVDTIRTVEALGADMIVMRHGTSGAPYLAAEVFSGSILNGGDGWHAHPSQALLDLYTMRAHLGDVRGKKVVILGDILHSRVARSNLWSLTASGADLWLCAPSTLLRGFDAWAGRWAGGGAPGHAGFHVTSDVDAALRDADVVMALRLQRERMDAGLLPSLREYSARFGLTRDAPGPDERGRRDRAGRGDPRPKRDHRAGDERRGGSDGPPLPPRRRTPGGRDQCMSCAWARSSRSWRSAAPGWWTRSAGARGRARLSSVTASWRP
jgi:aspartate carbamoyltransferase catalytic subunit